MEETKQLPIPEYYKGKTILLTGASGFVGKALLEKLLRSCPELKKVYIIIRPKKGKEVHERLEQIVSNSLFGSLKKTNPDFIKKIVPIRGDTATVGLGLTNSDRQLLIDEIQIFFHAAASVKFDDFLASAIFTNIRSAREAALLALEMKRIEGFMHVSTTYCNIDGRKLVQPVLYPPHGNWKEVIEIAEKCDAELLNTLSQKFIEGFPNTYTYTKQLAEHCINDLLNDRIPAIIVRPSVVVSTISEPFQGWIDNFNGPVGLLIAGGSGVLRTVYGDPNVITDFIVVDCLVKSMIVAFYHKVAIEADKKIQIYNASKYETLPFKMNVVVELGKRLYWDVPFAKKIWFPGNTMTSCWYNYYMNVILFHMIPAFFLDILLRIAGYPPILFKIQRKIYIANLAISHFMLNEWHFVNTNTMQLLDHILPEDNDEFNFNVLPASDEAVYQFYSSSCEHARKHLMNEVGPISERTRSWTRRLYYLDRACHYLFYAGVFWLVFCKLNILLVLWNVLWNYWNRL